MNFHTKKGASLNNHLNFDSHNKRETAPINFLILIKWRRITLCSAEVTRNQPPVINGPRYLHLAYE